MTKYQVLEHSEIWHRIISIVEDKQEISIILQGIKKIRAETNVSHLLIASLIQGMLLAGHGNAETIKVAGFLMGCLKENSGDEIAEFVAQFNLVMNEGWLGGFAYDKIRAVSPNIIHALACGASIRESAYETFVNLMGNTSKDVFAALLSEAKKAKPPLSTEYPDHRMDAIKYAFDPAKPGWEKSGVIVDTETDYLRKEYEQDNSWVNKQPEMTHMLGGSFCQRLL